MAEHKHAAVLRAIADGRDVQWRSVHMGHWNELSVGYYSPITHQDLEWRIKPEPKPDVVRYVNLYACRSAEEFIHEQSALITAQATPGTLGTIKYIKDGETGKLKSAEVLP